MFSSTRICALTLPQCVGCVLFKQNVCAYYAAVSTVECVLLLQNVCSYSAAVSGQPLGAALVVGSGMVLIATSDAIRGDKNVKMWYCMCVCVYIHIYI